ncbi:hypothetical protein UGMREWDR_CDS0140 [Aeromonas phage GomatiRiver_11]|nr:hypothetical protein OBDJBBDK_00132 [Aeromonas phage AhFM11]WKW84307.1 hypothetical protein UGMREWDR_CDS0140 [Aeromonas phage GomatiRiver_11]
MNYENVVKDFFANRADTSGNRYHRPGAFVTRLANRHHFMRLLNVIAPNLMPWSTSGAKHGVVKIKPNYLSLDVYKDRNVVVGTMWVNTEFEARCVENRLTRLVKYDVAIETAVRRNHNNYIITFEIITEPVELNGNVIEPGLDEIEPVNLETEKEICESIFFSEATRKAIQVVRGALHFGSKRLNEIDDEIAKLQAMRKEIEDNMKTIKNSIGA